MSLNNQLIETLKKEALDYSLVVNKKTVESNVRTLFNSIYQLKNRTLNKVEILPSPKAVQDRANELTKSSSKTVQSNISHNSLAPIVQCYRYLMKEHSDKTNETYKNIVDNFDCYFYAVALSDTVLVSEFPTFIQVDSQHRLHNLNGASMRFKDGFETFHFSGNVVDKELALTPVEKVTADMLAKISNADIRRDFIQKVGTSRLVKILNFKTIEEALGYRLIEFKVVNETHKYLMMVNPSMSDELLEFSDEISEIFYDNMDNNPKWVVHVEGVDDNCKTVIDALKCRNGKISPRKGFEISLEKPDNFLPNQLT